MTDNIPEFNETVINDSDCVSLIEKHYGISVNTIKRQLGFESITFLVTSNDGVKYTLKVLSTTGKGSLPEKDILREISVQRYLSDNGICVPKPIATVAGKDFDYEEFATKGSGRRTIPFRMQSYIDGRIIDFLNLKDGELYSPSVCRQLGETIGKMHLLLASGYKTDLPCHDEQLARMALTDMPIIDIFPTNSYLDDKKRAYYHKYYHEMYIPLVKDKIDQLPKHMIHCDLHGGNFLLDAETGSRLVGIIDFGLSRVTTRIIDPSMVVFNILLLRGDDGIEASRAFIEAYEAQCHMNAAEKAAFKTAVIGNFLRIYLFLCLNPVLATGILAFDGELNARGWNLLENLFDDASQMSKICSFQ